MIKRVITEKSRRIQKKIPFRFVKRFKGSGWCFYKQDKKTGMAIVERFVG